MTESVVSNKRIAKNTIMLYIRMLLSVVVSLYTSRVVLEVLGVEDYGIYNLVGGVVALFGFLNASMVASTQRFMSYSLGTNQCTQITKVFSTALLVHILIALTILVLAETIGLWIFYKKLVIPIERITSAFWVYQFSIIAFILNVIRVPDNSAIIAYEKMSAYAYFSIIEVILKLAIVLVLPCLPYDKLIAYSILTLIVIFMTNVIYRLYVSYNFNSVLFIPKFEKTLFKNMSHFAIWSLWGNLSVSMSSYGLNIVMNIFFGPVVNAARSIAYQVQTAIANFGYNFMTAVNPQIIKSYAQEDYDNMSKLVFRTSRLSFFLLFILALPIINNREFILQLWLGSYPEYTSGFVLLVLVDSLVNIMSLPIQTAINATGRVRLYQLIVGGILVANLPISYFLLKLGADPYLPLVVTILLSLLATVFRLCIFKCQTGMSHIRFYTNVLPRVLSVVTLSCLTIYLCGFTNSLTFASLLFNILLSVLIVVFFVICIGLEREERELILSKIFPKSKKYDSY